MNAALPTAAELQKLPIRAIVAYAARTARRASGELRGIVSDNILEHALGLIDSVWKAPFIGKIDAAAVIKASEEVVAACAGPASVKSVEMRVLFSVVQSALAAMRAIQVASDPSNARAHRLRAAKAAERAARLTEVLNSGAAEATRRDYEILLRKYGEHEDVVIGDLVDCFEPETEPETGSGFNSQDD